MSQSCVEFHVNVRSGDVHDRSKLGQPGWWSSARNDFFFLKDLWPFDLQCKQQRYTYTQTGLTLSNRLSCRMPGIQHCLFKELPPFTFFWSLRESLSVIFQSENIFFHYFVMRPKLEDYQGCNNQTIWTHALILKGLK